MYRYFQFYAHLKLLHIYIVDFIGLEVQQKTNLEPDLERSLAENDIKEKSNAQVFTFRELASATKNFRNDSIVGEGGFGPVYRGKLEKSGQVCQMDLKII